MISVCLPTYCRFDMVMDATRSLYDTCVDKKNFEVIVRFDDTDRESLCRLNELPDEPNFRYIVSDHKYGYRSLHEFQNELAGHSRGGWLLFWNDDVRMLTMGWDILTMQAAPSDRPAIINIATGTQFPTITRTLLKLLGHVSLHTAYDDYLNYIGNACKIVTTNNCFVDHSYHKGDKGGDDNDEQSLYIRHTFHSKATYSLIEADVRKVKEWLDEKNKSKLPAPDVGVRKDVQKKQRP